MTRGTSSQAVQIGVAVPARPKAALDPARLVVTLTLGELTELLREAALEAAAGVAEPAMALLDRAGLARALDVGISTVDRLRREGMPALWLGDAPRLELAGCLKWLRARGRGQP